MNIVGFDFNGSSVRTMDIDEKVYFIAKDIAEMLGYQNTTRTIKQYCKNPISAENLLKGGTETVPPLDKNFQLQTIMIPEAENIFKGSGKTVPPLDKNFQLQTIMIPESDVWRLIIKSRLPEAQKIEQWIFDEVLPTIRKTGVYTVHKELQEKFEKEVAEYKDKITGLESRIYDLEEDLSDDAKEDRRQFLESQKKNKDNAQLFIKRYTRKGYGADFHELYDAYEQYCKARGERAGIMLEFENNITTAHRYVFENLNGRFVANIELDKDAMKRDFSAYKEYLPTPSPTPAKKKTKKDDGIDMDKWNGKF